MGVVRVSGPASTPKSIHQLKVSLRHVRPPVWRRLQVPSDISLGDLHLVLQAAMGWEDGHLHLFSVGGETYANDRVEDPWGGRMKDEDRARLDKVAALGVRLRYEYDFGDGWEHDVVVEKAISGEPAVTYPPLPHGAPSLPPGGLRRPVGLRRSARGHRRPGGHRGQGALGMGGGRLRSRSVRSGGRQCVVHAPLPPQELTPSSPIAFGNHQRSGRQMARATSPPGRSVRGG